MATPGNAGGMASGSFRVAPEDLADAAVVVLNRAQEVDEELTQLQRMVSETAGFWTGKAADQYTGLMTDFQTYSAMLTNALTDIGKGLQGNYVNYSGTEQANLSTLQKIDSEYQLAQPGLKYQPPLAIPANPVPPSANFQ